MKKLLLIGALTLGAASCAPDINQDPPPDVVLADFNPAATPAVVPSPNDLAINPATGLVAAPIDPTSTAAQQEFTRDYVNSLNGFPTSIQATTKIPNLDKSTVNTNTVKFIDLLQGTPIATAPVTPTITYDEDTDVLTIAPPATGWPKGGRYAVALIGGDKGLKGAQGQQVVGSSVWALATLEKPLVTCEDLTAPNCAPTTDLIPSTKEDPVERLADQTASALRLEQLRRSYAPLLDAVAAQGPKREDIVLMWTFRIMNMPEATFDPATSIIPFPNDILRVKDATTGAFRLNLPIPANASDSQKQLLQGLNTLDGWSTTAPIVSENSDARGVIDTGSRLDPGSVTAGTKFIKLTPGGTAPNVVACLNCASSKNADGSTPNSPQQLQFVPQLPLDEKSTYGAVLTTSLKDERGRFVAPSSAFALVRLSSPLAVDGRSQVSVLTDAQANGLEPLRAGLKPMFDALEKGGLPRSKIALAWAFTTQSTLAIQQQLYALPAAQYGPAGLPNQPVYLANVTSVVKPQMINGGIPTGKIGEIFQGSLLVPFVLTGTAGTLNPTAPKFERIPFLLALPNPAEVPAPANGYPVTIFSHGLRSNRTTALPILSALATGGQATVAIDTVFHGDRSTCAGITAAAGFGDAIDTPDEACAKGTCDVNAASPTYGRCISASAVSCNPSSPALGDFFCANQATGSEGRCLPTSATDPTQGRCEGGSFKTASNGVVISGWNMLNLTNLFATRDNFRQHTIEHAQLVRVLASDGIDAQLAAQGAEKLDGTQINYIGQSLGGILGPVFTSASVSAPGLPPAVKRAVFNVPAGNLTGILFTSPAFAQVRAGFLAALAAQGLNQGTPGFDQFLTLSKAILDPADSINYVYAVENNPAAPTGREAFIQYIENDQVSPNALTEQLIAQGNRTEAPKKASVFKFAPTEAELASGRRHSFLLDFSNPTITTQAQTQAVTFVNTGTLP